MENNVVFVCGQVIRMLNLSASAILGPSNSHCSSSSQFQIHSSRRLVYRSIAAPGHRRQKVISTPSKCTILATNTSQSSRLWNYFHLITMPSSFPSIPRRPARTSESPDPLLSSSRPDSAPAGASTTATPPPEPSLHELYRTYRRQKQLADRYRSQRTPPLSERILSTAKTAWKETSKTAKKLSPVPALREQLETYQAKREQHRREAMKKTISPPVQQPESDFETTREYLQNAQAVARIGETSSAVQPGGEAGRVVPPTVGAAITTTTSTGPPTGLGILSPSTSSLATRRHQRRAASFSVYERSSFTNATTDSLGSRRGAFTEHINDEYDNDNHRDDHLYDDDSQRPDISSPMSFACEGDVEVAELPGSSPSPPPLPELPAASPLPGPRSITATIQCIHCRDLTGYEETGLCEACTPFYFASVPNPNRIPATPTTVTTTTATNRTSQRDSLVPSPLFSQRGSSHLSTITTNNNHNSNSNGRGREVSRPAIPPRLRLPFDSNPISSPSTSSAPRRLRRTFSFSSKSSLQQSPVISPINIRSIFPSPPRPLPSSSQQQLLSPPPSSLLSSPRFNPQFSPSTNTTTSDSFSSRSPPPSYSSRSFSPVVENPFTNFSGVTRTRTRRSRSLGSPIPTSATSTEQSYGGVNLPSYRDTLMMSPVRSLHRSSTDSPGTPLPEYSPPRREGGWGGAGPRISSPSSILGVYELQWSSDPNLGIRPRGATSSVQALPPRSRAASLISTRYSTSTSSSSSSSSSGGSRPVSGIFSTLTTIARENGSGNGSGGRSRTRIGHAGIPGIQEMDEDLIAYANSPPFDASPYNEIRGGGGPAPAGEEEEEEEEEEESRRGRREEVNNVRRRGQRRKAVSSVFSSVLDTARRRSMVLVTGRSSQRRERREGEERRGQR